MGQLSAEKVKEITKEAILSRKYDFILVNFANPDMVGHTGSLEAVIKACEKVDSCLGQLLDALDTVGGVALVTADHGNCDQMWDPSVDGPHTAHTLNPVELVVYGKGCEKLKLIPDDRRLADIAPTVLYFLGLSKPSEMTGAKPGYRIEVLNVSKTSSLPDRAFIQCHKWSNGSSGASL